jgi:hypothetical protein
MTAAVSVSPQIRHLAQWAGSLCHLNVNVILAQWMAEDGIGSNNHWLGTTNNPAGMRPGNPFVDQLSTGVNAWNFLTFATPTVGVKAYATMYITDRKYAGVRAAIASGHVVAELKAIIESPWDPGFHYNNGRTLIACYDEITGKNVKV